MQRRVFVAQAYLAYGGTYMAYHLGRILEICFGVKAVAISQVGETAELAQHAAIYRYDLSMPTIPIADIEAHATAGDILVACDITSKLLLGWRFPGTKICYVQSLQPVYTIDMRFDYYVSASNVIADYLRSAYNLATDVIPPFVNHELLPVAPNWIDRAANSILPYRKATKGSTEVWDISFEILRHRVTEAIPEIIFEEPLFSGANQPQSLILERIARARYILMLTEMEGFGLVPLEAMALGTIPLGYDGFGGRHYMRPGVNCAVVPCAKVEQAADAVINLLRDENRGKAMSDRARRTAEYFDYGSFAAAWTDRFASLLHLPVLAPSTTAYRPRKTPL